MSTSPRLTVLTATYNRAHTLGRVFSSLIAQTSRDFEWLVMDDGSTDGTAALMEAWKREAWFTLRYFQKENGGKHTAVNRALPLIRTDYTLILDSDDQCEPGAVEEILHRWDQLEAEPQDPAEHPFGALAFLCRTPGGSVVGSRFPRDVFDSDHLRAYFIHKIKGDKWECWKTAVLKDFPFPEPPGIKVLPESVVLNRIARKYRTRYFNLALRIYFDDGADSSLVRTRDPRKNAPGARLRELENLNRNMDYFIYAPRELFLSAVKYVRACRHCRIGLPELTADLKPWSARLLTAAAWLPGLAVALWEARGIRNVSGRSLTFQ